MSKKQMEALDATPVPNPLEGVAALERNEKWNRECALEKALQHHRINGGMMTPAQLIENAKQFHAYISGETK